MDDRYPPIDAVKTKLYKAAGFTLLLPIPISAFSEVYLLYT